MHVELNFLEHILRVFLVGFATTNELKLNDFLKSLPINYIFIEVTQPLWKLN